MKKTLKLWMLLVIALSIASCSDNSDSPVVYTTIEEALVSNGLFSDIKENPDKKAMERKKKGELDYLSQYSMFIEQPVNHNQPDADKFKKKVSIMFRGFDRPTIMVTEGYFWSDFRDAEDFGINLNANMVHVDWNQPECQHSTRGASQLRRILQSGQREMEFSNECPGLG